MLYINKRMLELFCGRNKSVSQVFADAGWETTTLDIDPKANPDISTNIMDWDFMQLPIGHYDYIHASPPCQELSRAKMGERDLVTPIVPGKAFPRKKCITDRR